MLTLLSEAQSLMAETSSATVDKRACSTTFRASANHIHANQISRKARLHLLLNLTSQRITQAREPGSKPTGMCCNRKTGTGKLKDAAGHHSPQSSCAGHPACPEDITGAQQQRYLGGWQETEIKLPYSGYHTLCQVNQGFCAGNQHIDTYTKETQLHSPNHETKLAHISTLLVMI